MSEQICLIGAKTDDRIVPNQLECPEVQACIGSEAKIKCPDCGLENLRVGTEEYSSVFIYCPACGYTCYLPEGPHDPV